MNKATVTEKPKFIEPATVTRLLVVSFFIALSLGLIEGADIKLLATPFFPETIALYSMRTLVLALSIMILAGLWRRPAALVLALIVFWPAYISLYNGGDVSAFWRDLALIGGLIMASSEPGKAASTGESEQAQDTSEVVQIAAAPVKSVKPPEDDAYREDFNLAHSS